jgi:acyl-CoA synthetase
VELHPGRALALEELVAHLREQGISVESWPEHLLVLDELPRSSGGKIAKGELKKEAARRLSAQERT